MARGRSLLILVVIALGLGAYLYFVEMKRDTSAPEEKKTRAFTVESGKIVEVEIITDRERLQKLDLAILSD